MLTNDVVSFEQPGPDITTFAEKLGGSFAVQMLLTAFREKKNDGLYLDNAFENVMSCLLQYCSF